MQAYQNNIPHPLHESDTDRFFSDIDNEMFKQQQKRNEIRQMFDLKRVERAEKEAATNTIDFRKITDLSDTLNIKIDMEDLKAIGRREFPVLDIGDEDDFISEEEIYAAIREKQIRRGFVVEYEVVKKSDSDEEENFFPDVDRQLIEEKKRGEDHLMTSSVGYPAMKREQTPKTPIHPKAIEETRKEANPLRGLPKNGPIKMKKSDFQKFIAELQQEKTERPHNEPAKKTDEQPISSERAKEANPLRGLPKNGPIKMKKSDLEKFRAEIRQEKVEGRNNEAAEKTEEQPTPSERAKEANPLQGLPKNGTIRMKKIDFQKLNADLEQERTTRN